MSQPDWGRDEAGSPGLQLPGVGRVFQHASAHTSRGQGQPSGLRAALRGCRGLFRHVFIASGPHQSQKGGSE